MVVFEEFGGGGGVPGYYPQGQGRAYPEPAYEFGGISMRLQSHTPVHVMAHSLAHTPGYGSGYTHGQGQGQGQGQYSQGQSFGQSSGPYSQGQRSSSLGGKRPLPGDNQMLSSSSSAKRPRASGGGTYGNYDDENNAMMMGRDEGEDLRHDNNQHKGEDWEEEVGEREEEDVLLMDEVLGISGVDTRVNPPHPHPQASRGHDGYPSTPSQTPTELAHAPLRVRLPFRSAVLPSDGPSDNPLALTGTRDTDGTTLVVAMSAVSLLAPSGGHGSSSSSSASSSSSGVNGYGPFKGSLLHIGREMHAAWVSTSTRL